MTDLSRNTPFGMSSQEPTTAELVGVFTSAWKSFFLLGCISAVIGYGLVLLIPPTFVAQTTIIPPQQQQSASVAAALGPLAGLVGGGALKSPSDQYVSIMTSATVSDQIINQFQLMAIYEEKIRSDARRELAKNVAISVGKKDGLLTISVEDRDPQRSADMANAYVVELRRMTNRLALSEAQQRRQFFEKKLLESKDGLAAAQLALQGSKYDSSVLRVEPRAAADAYAKLRAELTSADVKLQVMRNSLAENSPELQQQLTVVSALRKEMVRLEQSSQPAQDVDYIGRYRDFKYQETLFELYARQYELARADESREGVLIQVIDVATPPDRKSKPKKSYFVAGFFALGLLAAAARAYLRADKSHLVV